MTDELKQIILSALRLKSFDLGDETVASQVPGWDSLNHINVIVAVERHFRVRFSSLEILKLANLGDLQRLIDRKLAQRA